MPLALILSLNTSALQKGGRAKGEVKKSARIKLPKANLGHQQRKKNVIKKYE